MHFVSQVFYLCLTFSSLFSPFSPFFLASGYYLEIKCVYVWVRIWSRTSAGCVRGRNVVLEASQCLLCLVSTRSFGLTRGSGSDSENADVLVSSGMRPQERCHTNCRLGYYYRCFFYCPFSLFVWLSPFCFGEIRCDSEKKRNEASSRYAHVLALISPSHTCS